MAPEPGFVGVTAAIAARGEITGLAAWIVVFAPVVAAVPVVSEPLPGVAAPARSWSS